MRSVHSSKSSSGATTLNETFKFYEMSWCWRFCILHVGKKPFKFNHIKKENRIRNKLATFPFLTKCFHLSYSSVAEFSLLLSYTGSIHRQKFLISFVWEHYSICPSKGNTVLIAQCLPGRTSFISQECIESSEQGLWQIYSKPLLQSSTTEAQPGLTDWMQIY